MQPVTDALKSAPSAVSSRHVTGEKSRFLVFKPKLRGVRRPPQERIEKAL
jgi:hypothetical protein